TVVLYTLALHDALPISLDATDRRLIALLQDNARESVTELARKLKLGRSTVHERIARLERNGVILGYAPLLARNLGAHGSRAIVIDRKSTRLNSSHVKIS